MGGGDWLEDALLYEVYPQSFADSDGDGIGDLRGVIEHLHHIASFGVDAILFNPCFASAFVGAGYDVTPLLGSVVRTSNEKVHVAGFGYGVFALVPAESHHAHASRLGDLL